MAETYNSRVNTAASYSRRCGVATKTDGSPCLGPAMRGQDRCRMHGGSSPQAKAAARRRETDEGTRAQARRLATPRRIGALDALDEELARSQGWVDWLEARLADNPDAAWAPILQAERHHLAQLSARMAALDTDNRRVQLSQARVDHLERAFTRALERLGVDAADWSVRRVIGEELHKLVSGGTTEHAEPEPERTEPASEPAVVTAPNGQPLPPVLVRGDEAGLRDVGGRGETARPC